MAMPGTFPTPLACFIAALESPGAFRSNTPFRVGPAHGKASAAERLSSNTNISIVAASSSPMKIDGKSGLPPAHIKTAR